MKTGTHELRMYLDEERPHAVCLASTPAGSARIAWIPRSLIAYARKLAPARPGERAPYVFTLPEWKIEQAGLWDFAT